MPRKPRATSKPNSTTFNSTRTRHASYPLLLLKSVILVLLLAFTSLASQLALHPLYGSTPTALNHPRVVLLACVLSALLPFDAHPPEHFVLVGLASWVGYAPYATYTFGKWTTKWRNPVLGPAVAEALVLVPVISVGVALVRRWNSRLLSFLPGPMSLKMAVAICTFNSINVLERWLWSTIPLGGLINGSYIFVTIAIGLTIEACTVLPPPLKFKSKVTLRSYGRTLIPLLFPLVASALALSLPPSASPQLPYTRRTLTPALTSHSPTPPATVRVLARTHSVTGLILVGEHVEEGFRFLRADHSLLGGRWIGNKVPADARDGLGDSIYATFVLQEAVRLVKRERDAANERALFIGLGVGVAAQAFMTHGIETSVVEIDPAIYGYARAHFGLGEPAHVFLEDARGWVHRRAADGNDTYDYIVHDCFSGGGVPTHIFTVEFWEEVRHVVKPDGVIAVNFAGKMGSDAARAIFLTLRKSFGRCRAFHDQLEAAMDPMYTFFNIVFFCTPSSSEPPTFRRATKDDYLNSHMRRHVLGALKQREIDARLILGDVQYVSDADMVVSGEEKWVLRDGANRLGEWQQASGLEHWSVMREVMPDVFWETY